MLNDEFAFHLGLLPAHLHGHILSSVHVHDLPLWLQWVQILKIYISQGSV